MIPVVAANPTCDVIVIDPRPFVSFVIGLFGNWRDIIRFEFDVLICDIFFLGSFVNKPVSLEFRIFMFFW